MPTALGIDVGVRKGLDLVLLDDVGRVLETVRHAGLDDVPRTLDAFRPDVVAIDSPPAWGTSGGLRTAERELLRLGIHSYGTPSNPARQRSAFYDWMREGFRAFEAAASRRYVRYTGGPVAHTAMEVFPYASAVALAAHLPPPGLSRAERSEWRARLLRERGVATDLLHGPDQVDAALAALTGLRALDGGFVAVGRPYEGLIVLPVDRLPNGPFARVAARATANGAAVLPGLHRANVAAAQSFRGGSCPATTPSSFGADANRAGGRTSLAGAGAARVDGSEVEGDEMRFETKAIHAGQDPDPAYGAVSVPIYQTSTYAQEAVGKHKGYDYARTGNPTRTALQEALAALEGGARALSFASGMAAETALLHTLKAGQHVVLGDDVYGGTYRLMAGVLSPAMDLRFDAVDMTDLDALEKAIRDDTGVVWVETPTNPLLKIIDIAETARLAHEVGARCVVDNTFASPYLQQPLSLGADVVVHSATKYLGGHSDAVGGALVANDAELLDRLGFLQNAAGGVPGPFDCFLVLRGLKTLAVRMERHCANAQRIADFLLSHPKVTTVYYPGLPAHPGHDRAQRQMRGGFGGMVSFEMETEEQAHEVCGRTKLFFLAESLGGVESLIEHPGAMTHASVAGSPLEVPPTLVRLSVGIEHVDDLLEDLERALA